MSRIQYALVLFFIVTAVDKINSVSLFIDKNIGDTALRELQIGDDNDTGNSFLEERSRTKRDTEEEEETKREDKRDTVDSIKTPSVESDSIDSSEIQNYIRRRGSGHSGGTPSYHTKSHHGNHRGRSHGNHTRVHHGHHTGRHHGLHMSKVLMPIRRKAKISVPEELKGWKHGRKTLLIDLKDHGQNGLREYNLVADVVRSTKRHTHFRDYDFIKIEKIVNGYVWRKYRLRQKQIKQEAGFVNERMLFHGTNKVKEILQGGFDERYTQIPGNMFGAGLYFAEHSSKSNGYTFDHRKGCPVHNDINCDKCERQLLLCRVALGRMQRETTGKPIAHPNPTYHSLKGMVSKGGLRFTEYVVYKGEQVYPEYVITYKIVI